MYKQYIGGVAIGTISKRIMRRVIMRENLSEITYTKKSEDFRENNIISELKTT